MKFSLLTTLSIACLALVFVKAQTPGVVAGPADVSSPATDVGTDTTGM